MARICEGWALNENGIRQYEMTSLPLSSFPLGLCAVVNSQYITSQENKNDTAKIGR